MGSSNYGKRLLALVLLCCVFATGQVAQKTLSIRVNGFYVDLAWNASVTPGVTYAIYRSTKSGSGYLQVGTSTTLAYTDKTPRTGTYYYVVRAVKGGVESGNSNEVSATIT